MIGVQIASLPQRPFFLRRNAGSISRRAQVVTCSARALGAPGDLGDAKAP